MDNTMTILKNMTKTVQLNISNHDIKYFNNSDNSTEISYSDIMQTILNVNKTSNSTINIHRNSSETDSLHELTIAEKFGNFLTLYYTPVLVCFGSIGNILSVFVFFKTKLRKLSSSYYLAALGISDTCFLFGLLVPWLNFVDIHLYNKNVLCQLVTYLSGLCSFLSVWFVVAFTVERFIAVLYPLKRQTMCTVKRAKMVLAGLSTLGCIISLPYLVYAEPHYSEKLEEYICDVKEQYKVSKLVNQKQPIVKTSILFSSTT